MQTPTVKIGLLGCGTVGTQVVRILQEQNADLSQRAGAKLELAGIAVRNLDSPRDAVVPKGLLTTDIDSVLDKSDLVIELMGGIEPARTVMLTALRRGITVVTGNKAVLAEYGPELYDAAAESSADLYFEAAVAGAIPVVYGLRESLAGDSINKVLGIVNGTTNYILDQMATQGWTYEEALAEAQRLGYAEADPTADVEGLDAGAKCAILASLAFHTRVSLKDVNITGITGVTAADIAAARLSGHVIKLIAVASREHTDSGQAVSVQVAPTLVPLKHPLASIFGAYNAVVVEAAEAGRLMFYGQGAGGAPTASAVLSDVVAGASHIAHGGGAPQESAYARLPILPAEKMVSRKQIRLRVIDQPGTLAEIAQIYQRGGVSISAVSQEGSTGAADSVALLLTTHAASEEAHANVLEQLKTCNAVKEVTAVMRVEED